MNTGTAFPLLLRNDHRILRNESCSGYIDIFGIWNTGFYCPQSESKTAVYCCGTDTYKYCCTAKSSTSEETGDIPAATTVFIRTPVIIGVVAGVVIIAAFLILTVCFVCPCCFFYKKRTSHIPPGLYRIQCGTSSTTSALINLQSPLTPPNENNNIWSAQPQPPIFTTMVPPLLTNNWRPSGGGLTSHLPHPLNNRLPLPSTNPNNSFFPSHFIPNFHQINNHNRFQLQHPAPAAQPPMSSNLGTFRNNFWVNPNLDSTGTALSSYPNYHHQIGNGSSSSAYNLGNRNHNHHHHHQRPTLPLPTITNDLRNQNYGQISSSAIVEVDNGSIVSDSSNFPGSSAASSTASSNFPGASSSVSASDSTLTLNTQIGTNIGSPTLVTNGHLQEYSFISTSLPKSRSSGRFITQQARSVIATSGERSKAVSHSANCLNQGDSDVPNSYPNKIILHNSHDQGEGCSQNTPIRNLNLDLPLSTTSSSRLLLSTSNKPESCQFNSLSRIAALLQMKDDPVAVGVEETQKAGSAES